MHGKCLGSLNWMVCIERLNLNYVGLLCMEMIWEIETELMVNWMEIVGFKCDWEVVMFEQNYELGFLHIYGIDLWNDLKCLNVNLECGLWNCMKIYMASKLNWLEVVHRMVYVCNVNGLMELMEVHSMML